MTPEARLYYGRSVDLEDGLVLLPAGKNKRVFWVQCPACGPQLPETGRHDLYQRPSIVRRTNLSGVASCSLCGDDEPLKEILIPGERKASHERCTNRCLNGKTFCACGCLGRCHGEKICFCKEDADA